MKIYFLFLHSSSPLAVTFNLSREITQNSTALRHWVIPLALILCQKLHLVNHTALRLDPKLHWLDPFALRLVKTPLRSPFLHSDWSNPIELILLHSDWSTLHWDHPFCTQIGQNSIDKPFALKLVKIPLRTILHSNWSKYHLDVPFALRLVKMIELAICTQIGQNSIEITFLHSNWW